MALLRTPRWIGFSIVVLVAIVGFGLLSWWQFSRAEEKRLVQVDLQASLAGRPAGLERVLAAGAVPTASQFRPVIAEGTYDPASEVLVRKRPLDARNGFWVMTPLVPAAGDPVWVNRGWLAATGDALATPDVPLPPAGPVAVTGYLRLYDTVDGTENDGLPTGQVAAVAPSLLPSIGAADAFVQLASSVPEQTGLVPVPLPTIDADRNLSYAWQWLLFAAVAVSGWYFFLRREAREDAALTGRPSPDLIPATVGREA